MTIDRRRMLIQSAGYFAALGLSSRFAFADAKKTAKARLTGKDLATVEAAHPAGSEDVLEAKLDPNTQKLANVLLTKTRSACALAATNPKAKFQPGSLHAAAAAQIGRMKPKRQERAKTRAAQELASPTKATTFGAYAKADVSSATVKPAADVELTGALRDVATSLKDAQDAAEKEQKNGGGKKKKDKDPVFTKMQFQLNSVKCNEETSELSASDELLLGGHLVTRDGKIIKIDQFKYEDFDKGETRYLDFEACKALDQKTADQLRKLIDICPHGSTDDIYRGRKLAEADLSGGGTWNLIFLLGEEDTSGGFEGFLNDVYKKLKDEITDVLKDVMQGIGAGIGALLSAYLGPIGEAIGLAIGWALGKIVEWFSSLFDNKDDFIGAKSWSLKLDNHKQSYIKGLASDNLPAPKGQWASPMKKWTYKGDGGEYALRLHWRAFA